MGNNIIKPKFGYLYPLRPNGEVCIIYDTSFSSVDVYSVIMITGKDRGKHTNVRLRDIITQRGRCPDLEKDIHGYYRIVEICPEILTYYNTKPV